MKVFSSKPKNNKEKIREIVTNTIEIEKEKVVYKEPKILPIKPAFPIVTSNQKEEVKVSTLRNIDRNLVNGFLNLDDLFINLRKYLEDQSLRTQTTLNKLFAVSSDKSKEWKILEENISKEIKGFLKSIDIRDTRLIQTAQSTKTAIDNINTDRIEHLKEVISPLIKNLEEKINPIKELPNLTTEVQAATYIFKEFEKTLTSYKSSFEFLEEHLNKLTNFQKESVDPEIKFYYLQFTEKLGEMRSVLDGFKELAYSMKHITKEYESSLVAKLSQMEGKYSSTFSSLEQIIKSLKDNIKKDKTENIIVNNTYVNEISFVDTYFDLPSPENFKRKEIFVKRSIIRDWIWRRKGSYISDGNQWYRKTN